MKNFKKILCGMMAVMMVLCFAACGDESAVKDYVDDNRDVFIESFEASAGAYGDVDLEADGTKIVIKIDIDETYASMIDESSAQIMIDAMDGDTLLEGFQEEESAVSGLVIEVSADGDLLASDEF